MIEDILALCKTAVEDNLPAAFDAEDAAYAIADMAEFKFEIELKDIREIRFEESEELIVQNLPSLLMLPRGLSSVPYMTQFAQHTHLIDFILVLSDSNPKVLARRLFRSAEALRRTLTQYIEKSNQGSDRAFRVNIQNIDYSPLLDVSPAGLVKMSSLTVEIAEIEARP